MRKISVLCFVLFISLLLLAACGAASGGEEQNTDQQPADQQQNEEVAEPIMLDAVSFLPKNDPLTETINDWVAGVEKATDGRVTVDWKGGADVIPIAEQFEAVRSGVVDIIFNYTGQYQSYAPAVLGIPLSQLEPWEERESGFYDFMVDRHKEIDVMYLGRWLTGSPRIWLNQPVESLSDLEGKKIRSAPAYDRLFPALGISSVHVDPAEVYTSLQTGMVDGFVYGGLLGPRQNGWTDSTKYVLDHPFWNQNCTILMNLDVWNSIFEPHQEAIMEATAEYEHGMVEHYAEVDGQERRELENIGVKFIQFPPADAERFLQIAYDTEWAYVQEQVPEYAEELRQLASK